MILHYSMCEILLPTAFPFLSQYKDEGRKVGFRVGATVGPKFNETAKSDTGKP